MKFFGFKKNGNIFTWYLFGIKIRFKRKLKQDKNSKIEFYLIDSFEIFHFLPLYNRMKSRNINVRIVAEPCNINTACSWFDYDEAIKILKKHNIDYVELANPEALLAITTQKSDILSKYHNKKANLSYGFGFTKNYFINSIDTLIGFDYRFVHGKIQEDILKKFNMPAKILQVGYPKYSFFFNSSITRDSVLKELNIDTNKKILIYYPTWDEENSIKELCEKFKNVKDDYFIVTKPHHCTFRLDSKKNDLKLIMEFSDLVLDGNYDFAKSTLIGDIAIIDAKSGASTEVPFLNKDIKLILYAKSLCNCYINLIWDYAHVLSEPDDLISLLRFLSNNSDSYKIFRDTITSNLYQVNKGDNYYKKIDDMIDMIINNL